jgi:hypothetical protein
LRLGRCSAKADDETYLLRSGVGSPAYRELSSQITEGGQAQQANQRPSTTALTFKGVKSVRRSGDGKAFCTAGREGDSLEPPGQIRRLIAPHLTELRSAIHLIVEQDKPHRAGLRTTTFLTIAAGCRFGCCPRDGAATIQSKLYLLGDAERVVHFNSKIANNAGIDRRDGRKRFSWLRPFAAYGMILLATALAYVLLTETLAAHHVSVLLYLGAIMAALYRPWTACLLYAVVAAIWFIADKNIEQVLQGQDGEDSK